MYAVVGGVAPNNTLKLVPATLAPTATDITEPFEGSSYVTIMVEVAVTFVLLTVCTVLPPAQATLPLKKGAGVEGTQFVPLKVSTWPFVAVVVVPKGEPFIFVTTVAASVPVTSPAIGKADKSTVGATVFTVLVNILPDKPTVCDVEPANTLLIVCWRTTPVAFAVNI